MNLDKYREPVVNRREVADVLINIFKRKYNFKYIIYILAKLEKYNLINIYFEEYLPNYFNKYCKEADKFRLIQDLTEKCKN